ncbi:Ras guanine nucleotide exchange factor, partial [Reticulomyxa filosa]
MPVTLPITEKRSCSLIFWNVLNRTWTWQRNSLMATTEFFFLQKKKKVRVMCNHDLLGHLVSPASVNNVRCVRYLLESQLVKPLDRELKRALNLATLFQNEDCMKLLLSANYLDERDKAMRDYALQYLKEKSKSEVLLGYLKQHLNKLELKVVMNALCKVMQEMIKDRKCISTDLFNLCWLYDSNKMWEVMFSKCQQLLNIDTLSEKPNDWQWLSEYMVEDRNLLIWLERCVNDKDKEKNKDKDKEKKKKENEDNGDSDEDEEENEKKGNDIYWSKIKTLCDEQRYKEMIVYQNTLKKEIDSNEEKFAEICSWKCSNVISPKYLNKKSNWRQDAFPNGVKCHLSEQDLLQMSLKSRDVTFRPKHTYDFDLYLTELLSRAHEVDEQFQTLTKRIFNKCKGCSFLSGPIKTHERCKMKAQVEYRNENFPKSAHILDIIRCQATFDTIVNFRNGLFLLVDQIGANKTNFEIMRIKNGFEIKEINNNNNNNNKNDDGNKKLYSERLKLEIPQEYKDIKINVIFTNDKGLRVVGEIQLLLQPISTFKERQHQIYEISRQEEYRFGALKQVSIHSFAFQLKMSGCHPSSLSPLMLYFPLEFRRCPYVLTQKDSEGKNYLSQLAYNENLHLNCVQEMLQSGNFMPTQVVQKQLAETNQFGNYPLMYALWKQSSISLVQLFVPESSTNAQIIWNALDE